MFTAYLLKRNFPNFIAKKAIVSQGFTGRPREPQNPHAAPKARSPFLTDCWFGMSGEAGSLAGEEAITLALLTTQTPQIHGST